MARRSRPSKKVMFSSKLALHAYMLGLFGMETLQQQGSALTDKVTLNSFIISNTPLEQVSWWKENKTMEDFADYHVFFQIENKAGYVGKIFERAI